MKLCRTKTLEGFFDMIGEIEKIGQKMQENKAIIESLNWRYATKVFDKTRKLTDEQLEVVMEAFRLSPSSFGLQGWKFIRVIDDTKRETLREAAYGQTQVTDAAEFFVLAVPTNLSSTDIDKYVELTSKTRDLKIEDLEGMKKMLYASILNRSEEEKVQWLKRQVYIALGQVMTVCAMEGIDTCPMEGFDSNKFDQILGLKERNLTSVVALAVGFRSKNDKNSTLKKVRFPKEEVFFDV